MPVNLNDPRKIRLVSYKKYFLNKYVITINLFLTTRLILQGEKSEEHHDLEASYHKLNGGHHDHDSKVYIGYKPYYHEKKLKDRQKGYGHDDKRVSDIYHLC